MDHTESFKIHITGNKTKSTWTGEFTARKYLTHRQMLEKDRLYREFLGPVSPDMSRQQGRADALATLAVSLVKFPPFWKDSNNGLDLVDDNVLGELWDKVFAIQNPEEKAPDQKETDKLVEKTKKDESEKVEEDVDLE